MVFHALSAPRLLFSRMIKSMCSEGAPNWILIAPGRKEKIDLHRIDVRIKWDNTQ